MEILVGSASQSTIEKLSNRISNIEHANDFTKHILEEAITSINFTHLQTMENANSINNMVRVAEELFEQVFNISSYLSHSLSPLIQFTAHYVQAQETLERTRHYLMVLRQEYN